MEHIVDVLLRRDLSAVHGDGAQVGIDFVGAGARTLAVNRNGARAYELFAFPARADALAREYFIEPFECRADRLLFLLII